MIPAEVQSQLARLGITTTDEVALRELLEAHVETYTLVRLAPWPARRWKCRYRLMMGAKIYDAQSVAEAYAMGVVAALTTSP